MQTNYETFFFVTLSFYEILMNFVLTLSILVFIWLRNVHTLNIYVQNMLICHI